MVEPVSDSLIRDRDVADMLGCAKSTVWRHAATGIIPKPVKIGGMSRWRKSGIVAMINEASVSVLAGVE